MLTEKTKNFIEKVAIDMQGELEMDVPNKYSVKDIVEFVKSMGCYVLFGAKKHSYAVESNKSTIHLAFAEECLERGNTNDVLKVLFHEIWHFISDRISDDISDETYNSDYSEVSVNPREASANYFTRAMLLPEEEFVKNVINNVDSNGMCNIFAVARMFNVSYVDVIARGNDLSLWNKKGGM